MQSAEVLNPVGLCVARCLRDVVLVCAHAPSRLCGSSTGHCFANCLLHVKKRIQVNSGLTSEHPQPPACSLSAERRTASPEAALLPLICCHGQGSVAKKSEKL